MSVKHDLNEAGNLGMRSRRYEWHENYQIHWFMNCTGIL